MSENKKLTIKQQKFADEYIISGNGTESYLKAYAKQSRASAEANARKLLGNYSVKNYIDKRLEEIASEKIMKQEEVMEMLTRIARREEKEYIVITVKSRKSYYDDKGKKVIEETEKPEIIPIPSKLSDTNKSLELIGRRYGMWTDRLETEGGVNIVISGSDDLED